MKIAIVGSSAFAKQMVEYRDLLRVRGHEVNVHDHYVARAQGRLTELVERMKHEHAQVKKENDYIRWHYNEIVNSDAILVLNFDKNGIHNYIGGNTLMELGFAHVHHKKIFLLQPIPEISYRDEIEAVDPVVLNRNLDAIDEYTPTPQH